MPEAKVAEEQPGKDETICHRIRHDEGGERTGDEAADEGERRPRPSMVVMMRSKGPPEQPQAEKHDQDLAGAFQDGRPPGADQGALDDGCARQDDDDGRADMGQYQDGAGEHRAAPAAFGGVVGGEQRLAIPGLQRM